MMRRKERKKLRYGQKTMFNHLNKSRDTHEFMRHISDVVHSVILEMDKRIDNADTVSYHVHAEIIQDMIADIDFLCEEINMIKIVDNQPQIDFHGLISMIRFKRPYYIWVCGIVYFVSLN